MKRKKKRLIQSKPISRILSDPAGAGRGGHLSDAAYPRVKGSGPLPSRFCGIPLLLGLAPGGSAGRPTSPPDRWALTPPFHLRRFPRGKAGCVFSVAGSFPSPGTPLSGAPRPVEFGLSSPSPAGTRRPPGLLWIKSKNSSIFSTMKHLQGSVPRWPAGPLPGFPSAEHAELSHPVFPLRFAGEFPPPVCAAVHF